MTTSGQRPEVWYHCRLCGVEGRLGERAGHLRVSHPEILKDQEKALARVMMVVVPVAIGSGVGLLIGIYEILHLHLPDWYAYILVVLFGAANLSPFPYAAKSKRIHVDAVGDVLVACRVCDSKLRQGEVRPHLRSDHPAEFRYLMKWVYLFFGSLGVTIGLLLVFQPLVLPGLNLWWLVGLSAWMGLQVIAWRAIDHGHLTKARIAWQNTDLFSQPGKR